MTARSRSRNNIPHQGSHHQRANRAIASPVRPALDSHGHSATSHRMSPHFARRRQRNLFANAAMRFHQSATPSTAHFLMISSTREGQSFDHSVRRKHEDGQA